MKPTREDDWERLERAMRFLRNVARLPLEYDVELQEAVKKTWRGEPLDSPPPGATV